MIREELLLIITKELTGQASEDEKIILKDWFAESRENIDLYHSYMEAFLNGKYKLKAKNKDEVFNNLSKRLEFGKNRSTKKDINRGSRRQLAVRWLKVAAAVLIFVTSTFVLYHNKHFWYSTNSENDLSHEVIIKSNPRGEKSLFTLPDGTKVKLNSESYLEYYADYEHDRSVKLIGEAFFEVMKDTLRPFYVKTGDLRIRVLGTSFNVEAFPFENRVKVALVSGKVLIEKKKGVETEQLKYLNPDQMLIYDHQLSDYTITEFDPVEILGWKDGRLHFDETDFNEVIKKLERWYGVEFIVDSNTDLSGRFNGTYKGQSLDVILEGMAFTSDFNFKIRDKKVYIN